MAYKVKDITGKPILFKGEQIFGQDTFDTRIEDFSNKERSFLAVASAEAPDRMGDEIKVKGWKLEDYRKNPVVMPFHDYHSLPVGRSLEEFPKRKRLMFRPQFATYPEPLKMYEMYRDKYLKGFSVGFVPLVSEAIDSDGESDQFMFCGPMRFLEQTLLEVSVAPVPAHQDALAEIKSLVQKGELYIPARFLEEDKDLQIEEYDEYIHAIVNERTKFSKLYIMDFEEVKLVYGPYRGEEEKENHIHSFIFTEIAGLEDEDIEKYVKEKREEKRIEFPTETKEYIEKEYTEKDTVLITLIPAVDEKSFEESVFVKLGEGDDPAGGYLVPEDIEKPYPSEHACRLQDPGKYDEFKRGTRDHEGKEYSVIYGIKEGKSEDQAYRYNKDTWTASEARAHCDDHEGTFEEASGKASEKVPTFKYCVCTCGYYQDHEAGKPCQDIKCPECGKDLKGSNEIPEGKVAEVSQVKVFVFSKEAMEKLEEGMLPENSKLIVLDEGMALQYTKVGDIEQFEIVLVEEKIGAVLSKANKSKLEKAIALILEVIELAEKEEESSEGNKGADTILKIVEEKDEPGSQNDVISFPVNSKEELMEMVGSAIKTSLGKLK